MVIVSVHSDKITLKNARVTYQFVDYLIASWKNKAGCIFMSYGRKLKAGGTFLFKFFIFAVKKRERLEILTVKCPMCG